MTLRALALVTTLSIVVGTTAEAQGFVGQIGRFYDDGDGRSTAWDSAGDW